MQDYWTNMTNVIVRVIIGGVCVYTTVSVHTLTDHIPPYPLYKTADQKKVGTG
jgi:hypothetical protein